MLLNQPLCEELILSRFWGFTLLQFFTDGEGNIRFESINRKHFNPITGKLLQFQGDSAGIPIEAFPNMLFVGGERKLGIFAELIPAVLYKRGNMSDWAKFCNIFGMPIREYTYDAGDEVARRQLIADASRQGANAVYIHPKESNLTLIESGNKSGSSELYSHFAEYWDGQMDIRILGNTLTTDVGSTGTQALGTVHKQVEEEVNADDRDFILDTLNYHMKPIFSALGFDLDGGKFLYAEKKKIDPSQHIDIVVKLASMGLPISDEYLYETFDVEKPKNYGQLKKQKEEQNKQKEVEQAHRSAQKKEDENPDKKAFKNRLKGFFGVAPNP